MRKLTSSNVLLLVAFMIFVGISYPSSFAQIQGTGLPFEPQTNISSQNVIRGIWQL